MQAFPIRTPSSYLTPVATHQQTQPQLQKPQKAPRLANLLLLMNKQPLYTNRPGFSQHPLPPPPHAPQGQQKQIVASHKKLPSTTVPKVVQSSLLPSFQASRAEATKARVQEVGKEVLQDPISSDENISSESSLPESPTLPSRIQSLRISLCRYLEQQGPGAHSSIEDMYFREGLSSYVTFRLTQQDS